MGRPPELEGVEDGRRKGPPADDDVEPAGEVGLPDAGHCPDERPHETGEPAGVVAEVDDDPVHRMPADERQEPVREINERKPRHVVAGVVLEKDGVRSLQVSIPVKLIGIGEIERDVLSVGTGGAPLLKGPGRDPGLEGLSVQGPEGENRLLGDRDEAEAVEDLSQGQISGEPVLQPPLVLVGDDLRDRRDDGLERRPSQPHDLRMEKILVSGIRGRDEDAFLEPVELQRENRCRPEGDPRVGIPQGGDDAEKARHPLARVERGQVGAESADPLLELLVLGEGVHEMFMDLVDVAPEMVQVLEPLGVREVGGCHGGGKGQGRGRGRMEPGA